MGFVDRCRNYVTSLVRKRHSDPSCTKQSQFSVEQNPKRRSSTLTHYVWLVVNRHRKAQMQTRRSKYINKHMRCHLVPLPRQSELCPVTFLEPAKEKECQPPMTRQRTRADEGNQQVNLGHKVIEGLLDPTVRLGRGLDEERATAIGKSLAFLGLDDDLIPFIDLWLDEPGEVVTGEGMTLLPTIMMTASGEAYVSSSVNQRESELKDARSVTSYADYESIRRSIRRGGNK